LQALAGKTGLAWLTDFLDCVTDAAQRAGQELPRLQAAEERIGKLTQTARSHLPGAAGLLREATGREAWRAFIIA